MALLHNKDPLRHSLTVEERDPCWRIRLKRRGDGYEKIKGEG
jgi:hypothetical protein